MTITTSQNPQTQETTVEIVGGGRPLGLIMATIQETIQEAEAQGEATRRCAVEVPGRPDVLFRIHCRHDAETTAVRRDL
jgi:hypothetical protein